MRYVKNVRAHLCEHADKRVRPHCKNDVADVASVPSHVHARGFYIITFM